MKFKINTNILENIISLSISGIIIVIAYFVINNYPKVLEISSSIIKVLMPFIFGISIAFIIYPIQKYVENNILRNINIKQNFKRNISVFTAIFVLFIIVGSFFAVLIPQLYSSVNTLISSFSTYIEKGKDITQLFIIENKYTLNLINSLLKYSEEAMTSFLANMAIFLPSLINFSYSFIIGIFNMLIGVIIALYILMDKERFARQIKQILHALFSKNIVDSILDVSVLTARMFNQFIFGKTIDSLIIGVLCFIIISIIKIPYPLLISFVVGITNMIPVFGPFIGAIPCIFILLIIEPIKAVWFAIFILILQQVDGNIIGPRILGDSMGLPSLWIMFAIIIGGGFFGVVGMFIGVPVFSVIYILIKRVVRNKLISKNIVVE